MYAMGNRQSARHHIGSFIQKQVRATHAAPRNCPSIDFPPLPLTIDARFRICGTFVLPLYRTLIQPAFISSVFHITAFHYLPFAGSRFTAEARPRCIVGSFSFLDRSVEFLTNTQICFLPCMADKAGIWSSV
ncbi:hypothetical protein RvY_07283 [Ramazzottius varieornatus]|uniref:Uncharacterized protein n=1 Tax=Ramazzottius varieornatus TaxID=947166 RepID=A0A1D1V7Q6_RAMVA|nr:hypothetical protein RvY_07283 [Ramazzottius varieornatus]